VTRREDGTTEVADLRPERPYCPEATDGATCVIDDTKRTPLGALGHVGGFVVVLLDEELSGSVTGECEEVWGPPGSMEDPICRWVGETRSAAWLTLRDDAGRESRYPVGSSVHPGAPSAATPGARGTVARDDDGGIHVAWYDHEAALQYAELATD
jgi:hypothetical protein